MNNEFESPFEAMMWDEIRHPKTYNDPHNPNKQENNYDPYMYLYPKGKRNMGYRKIETPLLLLLATGFLSDIEMRVFWYIFDLTRGWTDKVSGKTEIREGTDFTSRVKFSKQCMKACKITFRQQFNKALKRLFERNVLYEWQEGDHKMISINFNITTWIASRANTQRDKEAQTKLDIVLSQL